MKIGMITDSVAELDFDAMLTLSARLRLDTLEFGCGNCPRRRTWTAERSWEIPGVVKLSWRASLGRDFRSAR